MAEDAEEIHLREGMPVSNEQGEELGILSALLVPEDATDGDDAEFLILSVGGADRLVPFEAVLGVGDDQLILDVPHKAVNLFPQVSQGADPTDEQMEAAYEVYDEHAEYVSADEE